MSGFNHSEVIVHEKNEEYEISANSIQCDLTNSHHLEKGFQQNWSGLIFIQNCVDQNNKPDIDEITNLLILTQSLLTSHLYPNSLPKLLFSSNFKHNFHLSVQNNKILFLLGKIIVDSSV